MQSHETGVDDTPNRSRLQLSYFYQKGLDRFLTGDTQHGQDPRYRTRPSKKTISLQQRVEARGITLTRHGADLIGLCPFHDDHDPSLVISPKTNLWHCLGACDQGGDVIQWVMQSEKVSFRHAVEILQNDHSFLAAEPASKQPATHKKLDSLALSQDDSVLLNQVIDFYHQTLLQSPEAQAE